MNFSYPPPDAGDTPAAPQAPQYVQVNAPGVEPTVSYALLGITILVYILQVISAQLLGANFLEYMLQGASNGIYADVLAVYGMKVNQLILQGQYWRFITPILLHGSILHIGFNMYALFILGPGLERRFGHTRFLLLYLLSGFAGNVASFIFSTAPSLGSSTAIFGLIGAQGVFIYRNRQLFAGRARAALTQIVFIALLNLAIGTTPGIDNWGHVGGLLGGLLFTWMAGPVMTIEGYPPYLTARDTREDREVYLAALLVFILTAVIAAGTIYLRGG
ncbi:MAG TPA: rhomboid family intramembrane serine protease [Anaerolineales bacterium]